MVSTRSSQGSASDSSPKGNEKAAAGTKRKEHVTSPKPEHEPKVAKKQAKIDEMLGEGDKGGEKGEQQEESLRKEEDKRNEDVEMTEDKKNDDVETADDKNDEEAQKQEQSTKEKPNEDNAIEHSPTREKKAPSNILEKGLIYFFTRNRVGIEDSDNVGDLQRTYFVLRPLSAAEKLGDGSIPDEKNNRLLVLPKKTFPKSHSDRFMAFVEKANTSVQDLKENVFKSTEYETKTAGTRRQEPVAPIGEGVYAITRTEDRSTHLAYALTIPSELGEVQEDLGLRSKGSFAVSIKNPKRSGPANAQLPKGPDFPEEIIEEFQGLAWPELKPKYLDYENAQILLIGENPDKALKPTKKDQKHGKDSPEKELEQLEHEDELRVKHLHGDDTVFDDLDMSKKEYSKVPTTW